MVVSASARFAEGRDVFDLAGALPFRLRFIRTFRGRLRHFADDLLRGFIFAQALERRMPQAAVGRPFGEFDFADQFGLHPGYAAAFAAGGRILERRLVDAALLQLRRDLLQATAL